MQPNQSSPSISDNTKSTESASPAVGGGPQVLLVYEHPNLLGVISELLVSQGFTVSTADSVQAALQIINEAAPDLIIIQAGMSRVDGLGLCREVKADPAKSDIPLLLAWQLRDQETDVTEALAAGADDYLEIDVPPALLLKRIQRLLADTQEKRGRLIAEAALGESGDLYRIVAETVSDAIVTIDENSTILFLNRAAEKVFGYSHHEMIGQNLTMIMPEHLRAIHQAAVNRYTRTGEKHLSWTGVELPGLHKSGKEISLEIAFGEYHRGGKQVFTGAIRDITERRLAEQSLKENEKRFRSLIEATFDGIVIHKDGVILEANRGFLRMFGYQLSEVSGKHIADFADEPYRDVILQNMRSETVQVYEVVGVRKDGTRINLELVGKDHYYKVQRARVTAMRDITREKQLQAHLAHSEAMAAMGRLVAGVAHEVRNPLFSISSILDAFEMRFGKQPEHERYTDILRQEVDRLNHLMQDLLDYGAPIGQKLTSGSIEEVISQATDSCAALAAKSNVQVTCNVVGELAPARMDARRLVQVFVNLLENAIHHSPPGGTVIVEARQAQHQQKNWLECSVKDAGPGFQAEDLGKIFDPFFTTRRGGTGLGLSIAQRIVEAHGGEIAADNRPEGGAELTVCLPIRRDQNQSKGESANGEKPHTDY